MPSPEHAPRYGEAYEHDRKEAMRGSKESAGLAPKQPVGERAMPAPHYREVVELSHGLRFGCSKGGCGLADDPALSHHGHGRGSFRVVVY